MQYIMSLIPKTQTSLTKEQKQAVGLLSIGTFLEYFDLMLYVHMAVLLNELFFPPGDPFTKKLIKAFFCSTFLLRPFGAMLFGYIGDNIGRKSTVIITTFMMALSSFTMFFAPTYAQVGIVASLIITICCITQGISSMEEIVGIYLTKLIKPPKRYPIVSFISVLSSFGTFAALGIAKLCVNYAFNWRYAFLVGSIVALIGFVARASLRETPEFLLAKNRIRSKKALEIVSSHKEKINKKVLLSYFFLQCAWPVWLYIIYMYYSGILNLHLGYSNTYIIQHNLYLTIAAMVSGTFITLLSIKIHPLAIMRIRFFIFCISFIFFTYLFETKISFVNLIMLQLFMVVFHPTVMPGDAIFFKYFPVLQRFTSVSLLFAFSRAMMHLIVSFGSVFLTESFGTYGLLVIILPVLLCYFYGLNTFIKLEEKDGSYCRKFFWGRKH